MLLELVVVRHLPISTNMREQEPGQEAQSSWLVQVYKAQAQCGQMEALEGRQVGIMKIWEAEVVVADESQFGTMC